MPVLSPLQWLLSCLWVDGTNFNFKKCLLPYFPTPLQIFEIIPLSPAPFCSLWTSEDHTLELGNSLVSHTHTHGSCLLSFASFVLPNVWAVKYLFSSCICFGVCVLRVLRGVCFNFFHFVNQLENILGKQFVVNKINYKWQSLFPYLSDQLFFLFIAVRILAVPFLTLSSQSGLCSTDMFVFE